MTSSGKPMTGLKKTNDSLKKTMSGDRGTIASRRQSGQTDRVLESHGTANSYHFSWPTYPHITLNY